MSHTHEDTRGDIHKNTRGGIHKDIREDIHEGNAAHAGGAAAASFRSLNQ
ncbi:hypothetical protein AB0P17_37305 [Streptomyces sp. NPDC088124]